MTTYAEARTIPGNCGIGFFSYLSYFDGAHYFGNNYSRPLIKGQRFPGGCGWQISGFINTKECRQAYKDLSTFAEIVFQSPVRINRNSGRKFFFVVYNTYTHRKTKKMPEGSKPNLENNNQYRWPL